MEGVMETWASDTTVYQLQAGYLCIFAKWERH